MVGDVAPGEAGVVLLSPQLSGGAQPIDGLDDRRRLAVVAVTQDQAEEVIDVPGLDDQSSVGEEFAGTEVGIQQHGPHRAAIRDPRHDRIAGSIAEDQSFAVGHDQGQVAGAHQRGQALSKESGGEEHRDQNRELRRTAMVRGRGGVTTRSRRIRNGLPNEKLLA